MKSPDRPVPWRCHRCWQMAVRRHCPIPRDQARTCHWVCCELCGAISGYVMREGRAIRAYFVKYAQA